MDAILSIEGDVSSQACLVVAELQDRDLRRDGLDVIESLDFEQPLVDDIDQLVASHGRTEDEDIDIAAAEGKAAGGGAKHADVDVPQDFLDLPLNPFEQSLAHGELL